MDFQKEPGIYNANTDELIVDYERALKQNVFKEKITNKNKKGIYEFDNNIIKENFYIILPEHIECILSNCFRGCDNLIGLSGNNIEFPHIQSVISCQNLEKVNFPNLLGAYGLSFFDCLKLRKNYTDKNGLYIINNCLISADDYKYEKICVSKDIKYIAYDAFVYNSYIKEITLPIDFSFQTLHFPKQINKIVLPVHSEYFGNIFFNNYTKRDYIYKGTYEQAKENVNGLDTNSITAYEPFTKEEILTGNYTPKELEYIFNRKPTLDELLGFGRTIKEANDYFKKGTDHEL